MREIVKYLNVMCMFLLHLFLYTFHGLPSNKLLFFFINPLVAVKLQQAEHWTHGTSSVPVVSQHSSTCVECVSCN